MLTTLLIRTNFKKYFGLYLKYSVTTAKLNLMLIV